MLSATRNALPGRSRSYCWVASMLPALVSGVAAPADDLQVSHPVKLHQGTLVVLHRPQRESSELLVHFHGAVETVRQAHLRTDSAAVLAVVNFPGLSSAYAQPFASDADLFDRILRHACEVSRPPEPEATDPQWRRVTLSCFSAGYGAVREILKTPAHFARVDAIVAADSIYAGLAPPSRERRVDPALMQDFLRFARLAGEGRKTFVISHSSQPTPYASTTETADYLLRELGLERRAEGTLTTEALRQTSCAACGRFLVLGFAGTEAQDHLEHLRRIDLFWKLGLAETRQDSEPD